MHVYLALYFFWPVPLWMLGDPGQGCEPDRGNVSSDTGRCLRGQVKDTEKGKSLR